jgi:membrane-associated phospholipid phosphatase
VTIVAAAYFAYLAGMAIARGRLRPAFLALAVLLCILLVGMQHIMPLVYLLVGYWLPALLVRTPDVVFEQRLLSLDRILFGVDGLAHFERRAPKPLIEYLEMSYLLCYAVVPTGYVLLMMFIRDEAAVDRFWSTVLIASFVCYGLLPWLPTRAPRALEGGRELTRSSIRRLNLAVLDRASVQWNTFPSGHTAASFATAFAVGAYMPTVGVVLGIVALSIAAGSVVGRYHYAGDAIAGVGTAILAFVMASAVRAL